MSKKEIPVLQELERLMKWSTKEYFLTPKDVRYYLGSLGYGRESSRDLLYKHGCPRPVRIIGGPWTPVAKTLVDLFIAARRRRKRCYRGTRLQIESFRLIMEKGLSYRAAARLMGVFPSTVFLGVKAMKRKMA